jgi:hypothetical protein
LAKGKEYRLAKRDTLAKGRRKRMLKLTREKNSYCTLVQGNEYGQRKEADRKKKRKVDKLKEY